MLLRPGGAAAEYAHSPGPRWATQPLLRVPSALAVFRRPSHPSSLPPRPLLPCRRLQVLYGVNQRLRMEDVDSPLVSQRPIKSVALVCVTGDRGLCGGYNK